MSRSNVVRDALRHQKTLWAAGCFDSLSALLIQEAGFDAVLTSGFGISASFLGKPDAELYTMSENLAVVRNVTEALTIPVIADIDTGYGNAINVIRTVREFESVGVSAVILEDQVSPKRCPACTGDIEIIPVDEARAKIEAAVEARANPDLVVIARTDALDPEEAIRRAKAYVAAGADMIQPISKCFKTADGLKALRDACGVPLSLQLLGWLERDLAPDFVEEIAGAATFPLVPLMTAAQALRTNLRALAASKSSRQLPAPVFDHQEFVEFIGFPEIDRLQLKYLRRQQAAE
jgi:methylisocitrate lyase